MLKRHSQPHRLEITFDADGKHADVRIAYHTGAYDTEEKAWVGQPLVVPQAVTTETPEGKKLLNDFLGLSFTALLEKLKATEAAREVASQEGGELRHKLTEAQQAQERMVGLLQGYKDAVQGAQASRRIEVERSAAEYNRMAAHLAAATSWRSRLTLGFWVPKV